MNNVLQALIHFFKQVGTDQSPPLDQKTLIAELDQFGLSLADLESTLEWRAREREHRLIIKIDQALASIKQGDYGYCEACGAEIGVRRLEARPTATQCIDCKTIDEIRERHTGTVE